MSAWTAKLRRPVAETALAVSLGALAVDVDGHDVGAGGRQSQG